SCACWPIMSSGTCVRAWPRCSTTTTTKPPPKPCVRAPSPRRSAPRRARQKRHRPHRRRRPRPLLPNPGRRSCDPGAKHGRDGERAKPPHHHPHPPHADPTKGLRPPGISHLVYPVAATPEPLAVSEIKALCAAEEGSSV